MTSKSLNFNRLCNATEEYVAQHLDGPEIRVIPSHIDEAGTPCGYVQSDDAEAVSAIEAMVAAKPRPERVYAFRTSGYELHPAMLIISSGRDLVATHHLSPAQYDRFVELANSGNYEVKILDSDFRIGWTLRRKGYIDNTVNGLQRDLAGAKRYVELMHQAMDSLGIRDEVDQEMIAIEDEDLPIHQM